MRDRSIRLERQAHTTLDQFLRIFPGGHEQRPPSPRAKPSLGSLRQSRSGSDLDRIVATFAPDALVNDARREFWGHDAIRAWAAKELVGDRISMAVSEILDHDDQPIVRANYDGDFDRTNLPDEIILTNYFIVRDNTITTLIVIRNQPTA